MRSTLRTGMTLTVISLLFLAFNLVWIDRLPTIRWDFSRAKIHTLSPQARQLLTTLESPVDLYYFNSRNDARRSQPLERYGERVEDLLKEYEKAANGMINLHIIDPLPYSEDAYKAALFGLDDVHGYLGLIGTRAGYGTQRIDTFGLDQEPMLEYEISHLIYKLINPQPPTIGLLSGLALDGSATQLLKQVRQNFNLVQLPSNIEQVPQSISTLMVVHPRALSDQALYAIEQFVLSGANLMIFVDPLSEMEPIPTPANSRLEGMLAAWGIQIPADKLLVDNLYAASSSAGPGEPMIRHPARLNLPRQAFQLDDVSSWKLHTVVVSSSGAISRTRKSRARLTPLLHSSRFSALVDSSRLASTNAFDSLFNESSPPAQQPIAVRLKGPAYSAFPDGREGRPPGLQKAAQIHAVVVADTDMLSDAVINSTANSNAMFVVNTLDNLAAPEVLADIHPRTTSPQTQQPLQQMREAAEQAYAQKASELEQRFERTEQAWQRLNPQNTGVVSQTVDTSTQLQALNKERLRLPMELHALEIEAYAAVHQQELMLKLLMILAVPLPLCLIAWALLLCQRRRRSASIGPFH